jgi:hypothetical protein
MRRAIEWMATPWIVGIKIESEEKKDTRTTWVRRENSNRSLATTLESLLGISNVTDKSASARNTIVAFTREYSRVSYPLRNVCTLS